MILFLITFVLYVSPLASLVNARASFKCRHFHSGEYTKCIFIPPLDVSLWKMSCLNPIVGTFLQGSRLNLVPVAVAQECDWLRMRLTEATDWSRCLRETDISQGFFLYCCQYGHKHLSFFQLQEVGLQAVNTKVTNFSIVFIWRKTYLLQCGVFWTLIQRITWFIGTDDFLESTETAQKFHRKSKD